MCSGARRCMYCEDGCADEVEHHHPKAFYPDLVFAWANFLFACARCNRRKSARFPLFSPSMDIVEITRARDATPAPPPEGTPVLLDPRKDDPLAYLRLDLRDTFTFRPIAAKGTTAHARAEWTLRVLGLNERDELIREAQKRLAAKPGEYYQKIYGLKEVGGTSVLYLSAVPFEQIGLNTKVPNEPVPALTWRALSFVPDVVSAGATLLGGVYWITHRREAVAKAEGRKGGRK